MKTRAEIVAIRIISLSDMYTANNQFTEKYAQDNPDVIKDLLYELGIDIKQPYEHQVNTHRNFFNKEYTGSRWVGYERTDQAWLESGYASQEAIDKSCGSRLLTDLYRSKGLTTDRIAGVWNDEDKQEEGK